MCGELSEESKSKGISDNLLCTHSQQLISFINSVTSLCRGQRRQFMWLKYYLNAQQLHHIKPREFPPSHLSLETRERCRYVCVLLSSDGIVPLSGKLYKQFHSSCGWRLMRSKGKDWSRWRGGRHVPHTVAPTMSCMLSYWNVPMKWLHYMVGKYWRICH